MKKLQPTKRPAGMRKLSPARDSASTIARFRRAKYLLRLYVSGSTLKSALAVENLKRVCENHLKGRYVLEVLDIHEHANLARDEQIVAVPTLIKRLPVPLRKLIGDLSDLDKVLFGLDLKVRG